MADLAIRGGRVVSPWGVVEADVIVEDGRIASIGAGCAIEVDRTIDATGLLVFPGLLDVHAHPVYLDDLEGLSVTAAHGGVTTVIHYAYAKPGEGLMDTLHRFREDGESRSILDFALHGGLFDPAHQSHEIPEGMAAGVTSYKMFMTYAKLGWMTDDYQLMRTLDILGRVGGMGIVHAENGLATDYLEDKSNEAGLDARTAFVSTRPAELEAEAIHRAIAMARVAGCPLYVAHMTARLGIDETSRARSTGQRVYAETCPQYLTLTEAALDTLGPLVKIGPPLRSPSDREALWDALAAGALDTVASDHAPKAKTKEDDFFAAPFGSPQVETMLSLVHDGGVHAGRMGLERLVQVMCENPARIFGLYPQKGVLQPGSDADLVIFDPRARLKVSAETQHSHAAYTAYEGMSLHGAPVLSIQRGEILVEGGEVRVHPGRGQFLKTQSGGAELSELRPPRPTEPR